VYVSFKAMLVAVCVVALVFVGWRFILPLASMYIGGLGVESPLPKRLVMAYPKLAVYLFVLGGPMLFLALLVTLIWLLRQHVTPR
jgi:hypothetical protein